MIGCCLCASVSASLIAQTSAETCLIEGYMLGRVIGLMPSGLRKLVDNVVCDRHRNHLIKVLEEVYRTEGDPNVDAVKGFVEEMLKELRVRRLRAVD